ncbi:MAG TPA: PDZ domain-containing protein [Steroidobacteraceae bacterium]|nr:PDZ domain-containing protein [Steroidobacteraceae bacterium]
MTLDATAAAPRAASASASARAVTLCLGAIIAATAARGALADGAPLRLAQASEAGASSSASDLESQLDAARQRLEKAAREVAELSAQMGGGAGGGPIFIQRGMRRAIIGLQLDPASGSGGARVLEVSPGGPAADAGVHRGDLIVAVNGTPIAGTDTARQVIERLRDVEPDAKVTLRVLRAGKSKELHVVARPAFAFAFATGPFPGAPRPPLPPEPPAQVIGAFPALPYLRALSEATSGMELASLTPGLGAYFGTETGVLVVRAPASHAFHLKDGDVILAIDDRVPRSASHATRILESYQPGERIKLKIMREKRAMSLDVTLPPPQD